MLTRAVLRFIRAPIRFIRFSVDLFRVLRSVDRRGLDRLNLVYAGSRAGRHKGKYLEYTRWLELQLRRANALGLRKGRRLRILDIGTGAGYFPYVCTWFGHQAVGTEIGDGREAAETRQLELLSMYRDITGVLGVERIYWKIRPFHEVPKLGRKFDLITAFAVWFDREADGQVWDVPEWRFFLRSLSENLLADRGRLVLMLNRETGKREENEARLDRVLRFFKESGAGVRDFIVDWRPSKAVPRAAQDGVPDRSKGR